MTVVRLCIDHAGVLEATEDQVVVNELQDYARAHQEMTQALHAGNPLTIVVRHRACAAWLQRAATKYGPERVAVQEITRRGRLSDLWGVAVPAWVSEQDIERSDLLALPPLRAQPGQSFEDVILEAFYSPFLTYGRLPLNRLAELLEGYDQAAWEAADRRPLAQVIRRRRLEAWQESAQSEGEKVVGGDAPGEPREAARRPLPLPPAPKLPARGRPPRVGSDVGSTPGHAAQPERSAGGRRSDPGRPGPG